MSEPMTFALHIDHRDQDESARVVGPFASHGDAKAALVAAGWDQDDRPGFANVWHSPEDFTYTALVLPIETAL